MRTDMRERDFLELIDKEPTNEDLKSVFADWLEENGDPRTQLLRTDLEVAQLLGFENVHGILSAQRFYRSLPPSITRAVVEQLQNIGDTLMNTVRQCTQAGEDYMFVLDPGYDVCTIKEQADCNQPPEGQKYFRDDYTWYVDSDVKFARMKRRPRYFLIPKKFPEDIKTERGLVLQVGDGPHQHLLSTSQWLNALLLHQQDTRERLHADHALCCAELSLGHWLVPVASYNDLGIMIMQYRWENYFSRPRTMSLPCATYREFSD